MFRVLFVHGVLLNLAIYLICDVDETDITEYLETWRKALDERGVRISRPRTQFMDFNFGQDNDQEREPVKMPECIVLSVSVQAWRKQEARKHKLHRE